VSVGQRRPRLPLRRQPQQQARVRPPEDTDSECGMFDQNSEVLFRRQVPATELYKRHVLGGPWGTQNVIAHRTASRVPSTYIWNTLQH